MGNPLDWNCTHMGCLVAAGKRCLWDDGKGGLEERDEFHPERIMQAAGLGAQPLSRSTIEAALEDVNAL